MQLYKQIGEEVSQATNRVLTCGKMLSIRTPISGVAASRRLKDSNSTPSTLHLDTLRAFSRASLTPAALHLDSPLIGA